MNTKKINLGIGIVWGISLLLGIIYNAILLPASSPAHTSEHLIYYVTYLICLTGSVIFLWWFTNRIKKHCPGRSFLLMFIPLMLAVVVLHFTTGMNEIMGVTFVICVLFPLFTQFIKQNIYKKHSKLKIFGIMFLLVIAGYLVGGFNILGLTAAVSILTIATSVFVYDVEKPKYWYIGLVASGFLLILLSSTLMALFSNYALDIMTGYLDPRNSNIYSEIVKHLEKVQLFKFEIASEFLNNIQYDGSSIYMHITDMFGIVISGALIIAQIIGTGLMIKRSKYLNDKNRRIFGVMMSLVVGTQILFSIGSSFSRGPINDSGIPFISCKGLELSLVPYLLFILNLNADKNCIPEEKNSSPVNSEQNKKKPLYAYIFEFVGLEDDVEKIEEWRR